MANIKRANTSGITKTGSAVPDVVDAPTIGTATDVGTSRAYNNGSATVAFTAATTGGAASTFTATSSPGGLTGSSATSPITVTGLTSATAYTFSVQGVNSSGTWPASSASNSITATTVPQAPTIGTVSVTNATTVSIPFTAGATGGSAITSYTATSSPSISLSTSGTSTPLTVTGTFAANTAYTFTITATNANGTSSASSSSNSVTPLSLAFDSIASATGTGSSGTVTFSSIPSTYSHLQIRAVTKNTTTATGGATIGYKITFNSDTGNNYKESYVSGAGTVSDSSLTANKSITVYGSNSYASTTSMSVSVVDLLEYASTSKYKAISYTAGNALAGTGTDSCVFGSGVWLNTAAINSITITSPSGFFSTTTQFALYGIKGS